MARNDLTSPLGLKPLPRARSRHFQIGVAGAALAVLPVLVGLVWVAIVDDPLGGEPVAVAPLSPSRYGLTATDIGVAGPAAPGGPRPIAPRGPSAQADPRNLSVVPLATLVERGAHGPLPRIAADGTRPLDAYARPVAPADAGLPKVVVIVGGIGLSQTGTEEALKHLPGTVTLAFAPYGTQLDRWLARARAAGHEVMLQLPLEPFDYPDSDPGPHTLLLDQTAEANRDRLAFLLSRTTNYTGVVTHMGGRFLAAEEAVQALARDLAGRGLLLLDEGTAPRSAAAEAARGLKAPFLRGDLVLDATGGEQAIDARLQQLEQIARAKGVAVGVASALPVSARRIGEWAKGLAARGIALVPASAAVRPGEG